VTVVFVGVGGVTDGGWRIEAVAEMFEFHMPRMLHRVELIEEVGVEKVDVVGGDADDRT
jgi:hypothetical protein